MARLAAAPALVAFLTLVPSAAHAQASISGVVRDASGAVLPGVEVDASSPALIEKVRTAVTDGTIAPGTLYGDGVNELDLRLAKVLRFGRTRTNVGFDVYNLLNANPVLTYNAAFIPNGNWLVPTSVL
jgi:hypothetical protein